MVLVGPTASGKSALAMAAARRRGDIEIVSIDSMQVYRGMDIGTGKPTPDERAEVPHHLIDVAEVSEDFSVARFQAMARAAIDDIERRGRRALLVGGTGLYVRAVVDGLTLPAEFPETRAALEAEPDTSALHRRLAELDPVAATRMEPSNRRRVLRALEVTVGSGRPFSAYGPGFRSFPATPFLLSGVWLPRSVLARRIEARFDEMLAAGLVDEVSGLPARAGELSRTARQALGYKELFGHVEAGTPLAEARDDAVRRTRRFARRQRVWFRSDPRIVWHGAPADPVSILPALLGDWRARCRP